MIKWPPGMLSPMAGWRRTSPTDRYTVKIAGPYQQPGDEFEFLKRRYQIQSDGSITVRAPVRLYNDLFELAGRPKVKATPGPSGQDDMFATIQSLSSRPTNQQPRR